MQDQGFSVLTFCRGSFERFFEAEYWCLIMEYLLCGRRVPGVG